MRKLAWLMIILVVAVAVFLTLGITNYAGIGTTIGNGLHDSLLMPIRNTIVTYWLFTGTSGWLILAVTFGISIIGGLFWVLIVYGLVWKKGIQGKLLGKKKESAPLMSLQRTTSTNLTPAAQASPATPQPETKPEEAQVS